MFRSFLKKRFAVGGIAAIAALALAAGAYAFFTSSGTGSGTASVGTTGSNIYVTGATTGAVYPGGPTRTVKFTAYNFANFNQAISGIHATNVQACAQPWSTPVLTSYPVPAPTCGDTGSAATQDAACTSYGAALLSTGATNNTADEFWIPDTTVSPTGDGNLGSNATGVALSETSSVTMNDLDVNENSCENENLEFTFTTS